MKWTPFTLHVKVTPQSSDTSGARVSYIRSLQKYGQDLYDALRVEPDLNVANPGGGQVSNPNGYTDTQYYNQDTLETSSYSKTSGFSGTAVKPQFGNYPAQLMITGFYSTTSSVADNYPAYQVISAGTVYTGYDSASNKNTPSATVNSEVKSLKATIDAMLVAYLPEYANAKVHRLEYSGIIFGDRGYHFPV